MFTDSNQNLKTTLNILKISKVSVLENDCIEEFFFNFRILLNES